jgi:hypothetical protein
MRTPRGNAFGEAKQAIDSNIRFMPGLRLSRNKGSKPKRHAVKKIKQSRAKRAMLIYSFAAVT